MFLDEDPSRQGFNAVALENGNGGLQDDRAIVEPGRHEMDGGAGHADTVLECLTLRLEARERRQQRRMNVEDAIGKCLEQLRSNPPHIPGKANQTDSARAKDLDDSTIVRIAIGVVGWHKAYRLDAGVASPFKPWSIRTIRNNDRNHGIELSGGNRVEDRLQVAAASRDKNCDPVSGVVFSLGHV
jgi:hypothetical protein